MQSESCHNSVKYDKKKANFIFASKFYQKYVYLGNKLKMRTKCDGIIRVKGSKKGWHGNGRVIKNAEWPVESANSRLDWG